MKAINLIVILLLIVLLFGSTIGSIYIMGVIIAISIFKYRVIMIDTETGMEVDAVQFIKRLYTSLVHITKNSQKDDSEDAVIIEEKENIKR